QNDVYRAYGKDIAEFSLRVYDRWGGVVYNGQNLIDSWDGTSKGKPIESGFYFAVLKAIGKDGKNFELYEKVRLVR
ncbi:MAG: gliding motility-associated C-terminal domain-containing protein, partial [Chitinophagales bacterium]